MLYGRGACDMKARRRRRPGGAAGDRRGGGRARRRGDARHGARRGGRRRRDARGDPGRVHRRLGGHHRADAARGRDGPGRGDHVHAHVHGRSAHAAFRRRGRLGASRSSWPVMDALGRNERERNAAEQLQSMRDLGLPYPTSIGRVAAGEWSSTVPDRLVAEGRYGVRVGQTRGRGRGRAARRSSPRPAPATSGCATIRSTCEITGGRFAAAVGAVRPPAAVGPRRGRPRRPRPAAADFVGVPYGSDARLLIDHGATPTVLYGPGDPEPAPTRRTSTSRSRTSPAARACSRCGSCARSAEAETLASGHRLCSQAPGPGPLGFVRALAHG